MSPLSQAEKARRFLELHHVPPLLLLPNAWDVASARIFEEAGFPAIATTSAGVANSLGYPDGEIIPRDEMLATVERIARAVSAPVTADLEAGYGRMPEEAAETARGAIAAGAVGLNLEDSDSQRGEGLADISLQKEKIQAMLEAARKMGIALVLNARTDVFLLEIGDPATRLERVVERLNAYHDAGAPCLFAPGMRDAETIGRLARAIRGPLNILASTGTPTLRKLEKLGVARVSLGSGPMRATLGLLARLARQLREQGNFEAMLEGAMSYADANRLLEKH